MSFAAETPVQSLDSAFADPDLDSKLVTVAAGEELYGPDTPCQTVYLIREGQVRIYQVGPDNASRLVEILGPGDWLGSAPLAGAQTYDTRAVAMVTSVIAAVPAARLLDYLSEKPGAAMELIRQLASRLRFAREDAARLVFDDCNGRLIKTLLRFSRSAAATHEGDTVVLRITHHQLAQAVGVARETVSLALTQLRHQNLLQTGRNQLTFNPQDLLNRAGGNGRQVQSVA